jgi:hypothetical protein
MRAPTPRRPLDEIVTEAVELLEPPAIALDEWRGKITDAIERVGNRESFWVDGGEPLRASDFEKLDEHAAAVRAARATALRLRKCFGSAEFLAHLDEELARIKFTKAAFYLHRPKGKKRADHHASQAVDEALDLLVACQKKPTQYPGGAWHKLSLLLYEAATGRQEESLMHYLRQRAKPPARAFRIV